MRGTAWRYFRARGSEFMTWNSPLPCTISMICSTPISATRSPATGTEIQILKRTHVLQTDQLKQMTSHTPDGMKSFTEVGPFAPIFNEIHYGVELGILPGLEAFRVVQYKSIIYHWDKIQHRYRLFLGHRKRRAFEERSASRRFENDTRTYGFYDTKYFIN